MAVPGSLHLGAGSEARLPRKSLHPTPHILSPGTASKAGDCSTCKGRCFVGARYLPPRSPLYSHTPQLKFCNRKKKSSGSNRKLRVYQKFIVTATIYWLLCARWFINISHTFLGFIYCSASFYGAPMCQALSLVSRDSRKSNFCSHVQWEGKMYFISCYQYYGMEHKEWVQDDTGRRESEPSGYQGEEKFWHRKFVRARPWGKWILGVPQEQDWSMIQMWKNSVRKLNAMSD